MKTYTVRLSGFRFRVTALDYCNAVDQVTAAYPLLWSAQ